MPRGDRIIIGIFVVGFIGAILYDVAVWRNCRLTNSFTFCWAVLSK